MINFLKKKPFVPLYPLVFTSFTFLIPFFTFIYNIINNDFYLLLNYWPVILSVSSCITSCASIYNWLSPGIVLRQNIDRIFASTGMIIYSFRGIYILKKIYYLLFFIMITGYLMSQYLQKNNNSTWIFSHIIFHISVTFGTYFVMIASIKNIKERNKFNK